ncbi:sugar ABC transporter substrate-binding protein [Kovacikia minuta CCNUW1]|uniref:sugar ABC transporter substrate-binding protein n=1 Tax=Kovacikia minuta TaxID=2931930 RepID=UPI001CC9FBB4|nr:sugar ABC transporter substrate-binding protein [Kovacikia minuta]UBF25687.1 sugar ABC transporter substrate-binding protein [Kovacikia minuta CCNUW1]
MIKPLKIFLSSFPITGLLLLVGCNNSPPGNQADNAQPNQANNVTNTAATYPAAKGCKNVGVLLPESDSSARYEAYDRPLLEQEIKKAVPGVTIQYTNANNNADTQQNQAEALLTKGACILVVDPQDADKAAVIVQKARASQVPVISYDRLIQDPDLAYYVSFDNVKVGELQGQYLADLYQKGANGLKKGANLVLLAGAQTDNNALLFRQGALNKLQPLIDQKNVDLVFDQYTPNWDPTRAQNLMEGALTKQGNDVQMVYAANDTLANAAIAALRTQKLNGKVPVTGQDATPTGIQNILAGDQVMTVYKPIAKEAQATAQLVAALSNGTDPGSLVNGQTDLKGGGKVASVLLTPIAVDKNNVKQTVIADGFVKKDQVCQGAAEKSTACQ